MTKLITGLTLTFFPLASKIKGEGLKELKKLRKDLEEIADERGFEISDQMIFLAPQLHGYLQLDLTTKISKRLPRKKR